MNADNSLFRCNFSVGSRLHTTSKMSAITNYLFLISENSVYQSKYQPQPEIKKCTLKMHPEYNKNNTND